MTIPSGFYTNKHLYKYVTYSYREGISYALKMIASVSIFALISMIVSLIIGIRKKDCIVILTGNIMVKTAIVPLLYAVLDNYNEVIDILVFITTTIIEGFIYKKVLKYKKYSGMTVSLICNIATVIIWYLIINII